MAASIEAIKSDLPDWPDDIIDSWLLPHARRDGFGWPPPPNLHNSEWLFVLERPLRWWKRVTWTLEDHQLSDAQMAPAQMLRTLQMHQAYFGGVLNPYSAVDSGQVRVNSVIKFLVSHGILPRAPIALRKSDGLHMVDGNHRFLGWHMYGTVTVAQAAEEGWTPRSNTTPVWVGDHTPSRR